jgi:hypothetical protein
MTRTRTKKNVENNFDGNLFFLLFLVMREGILVLFTLLFRSFFFISSGDERSKVTAKRPDVVSFLIPGCMSSPRGSDFPSL